ncbi:MAG: hypothetical protein ACW960_04875 [Candidatus Thorarchaeota archaeon]
MTLRKTWLCLCLVIGLALVFMTAIPSSAAIQWSDDFNDANYNDWTVLEGEWSAENNSLQVSGGTPIGCDLCVFPGTIYHESSVGTGTWSFDIEYDLTLTEEAAVPKFFFMSTDPSAWEGYCVEVQPVIAGESVIASFRLLRATSTPGIVGVQYTILGSFDVDEGNKGSSHIDVTRAADGQLTVWIDDTQAIQATDTVIDSDACDFFVVFTNLGWAFDNVVVNDAITVGQFPLILAAAAGLVVVFVLVLFIRRR